jgi:hypothetical protein
LFYQEVQFCIRLCRNCLLDLFITSFYCTIIYKCRSFYVTVMFSVFVSEIYLKKTNILFFVHVYYICCIQLIAQIIKQTSSSFRSKLTCSHHDIAELALNNNHSLTLQPLNTVLYTVPDNFKGVDFIWKIYASYCPY